MALAVALAVDNRNLAEEWCSDHEGHLDAIAGNQGWFQLHRVSVHVSVVHDDVPTKELKELRSKPISREMTAMLDWQPDARDDQDIEEVLHHLKEISDTMKLTNSKSMVGYAECPNFLVRSGGKPASAFRQYSVKCSMIRSDPSEAHGYYLITHTDLQGVIPGVERGTWSKWAYEPKIVWAPGRRGRYFLVWHLQLDFVDLRDKPTKRRRGRNEFHTIGPSEPKRRCSGAGGKREFSGVRRREERQRWVAEMRPYAGSKKSKVQFGEYKDLFQAARAVDAAFYYYDKHNNLNFPESTPQLLASRHVPAGLDEPQKLKFVQKQAKWLAARTTEASSSSAPSSTSMVLMPAIELRTYSEIMPSAAICGDGGGETDDGISQPHPWLLGDPNYDLTQWIELLLSPPMQSSKDTDS